MPEIETAEVCFVDTNIWLYAFIRGQDANKAAQSQSIVRESSRIALSTQVINEICVNLLRKTNLNETAIRSLMASFFGRFIVVSPELSAMLKASELREKHSYSFWDSLIVASALQINAAILYSEDMQHGTIIDNRLKIINPFVAQK